MSEHKRGTLALLLCGAIAAAFGCESEGMAPGRALSRAAPFREHFATFERWARRARVAGPEVNNRQTLYETVVAPIRRDDQVVAAWVGVPGRGEIAFPKGLVQPACDWVRVRDRRLGMLDVAVSDMDDPRRRDRTRVILIRRGSPPVTVAYRPSSE